MVKKQDGLTIIQLMVLLLIAGVAGSLAVKAIIEYRCENDVSASMCLKTSMLPADPSSTRINRQPA